MRIKKIRKMIKDAVALENRHGQLANLLREHSRRSGARPSEDDITNGVSWVREYIEHVPYYLEQGITTAQIVGLGPQMAQMCGELEAYWFEADDAIPDRLGLLGLLDDAYVSLMLLQSVSEYCQQMIGKPILENDLTVANRGARALIGEPIASHLDQRIGVTIGQAMMQQVMSQLVAGGGFRFGSVPDPMWGNASMEEVVNARLGAMGVV